MLDVLIKGPPLTRRYCTVHCRKKKIGKQDIHISTHAALLVMAVKRGFLR